MTSTKQALNTLEASDPGRLIEAYQRGNLLSRTVSNSGNLKAMSFQRIAKFLALPLEDLVKPFNFTTSNDQKFEVSVTSFLGDSISLVFRSVTDSNVYDVNLTLSDDGRWKTADDCKLQLTAVDVKALPTRIISTAQNLPIGYMWSNGLISDRNMALILFAYIGNVSSLLQVKLNQETSRILGQILYSELVNNPESENFTVKEFLGSATRNGSYKPGYYNLDWNIVKAFQSEQKTDLKTLPAFRKAR